MTRKLLIQIHLILAAFMAPAFILAAISGGLYLLDIKGNTSQEPITVPAGFTLDFQSPTIKDDVKAFLESQGHMDKFQYIKDRGDVIQTRPTSRAYYQLELDDGVMTASYRDPNFQASMMELHKGHGPVAFKWYQKFVALALLFVVLSGLWMGLWSKPLRKRTLWVTSLGTLVILGLVFII
ncbi:PepSY-associated TM helix domain-containing protein [Robiginitomaculum antarcticum]|uniref:PepSY-associated TM helix domain-containing protein n=1 Tax=Robiginitomaculum antarcticum TaxID=437507 RepID=UPI000476049D|nr:PepSY-associated TM helix domain-containing protein [Robiginitomaculum antarcticum]